MPIAANRFSRPAGPRSPRGPSARRGGGSSGEPLPGARASALLFWTLIFYFSTEAVLVLQEVCNLFAPHFLTDLYLQNPLVMVFQSVLGLLCWVPLILALVLLAQSMSDRRRYSAGVRYVTGAIVAAFGLRMVINMIWVAITFSAAFQAGGHVSAQVLARTTIDDNPVLYSGTQGLVLLISLAAVIIVIRNMMQMKGAHVVPPARRGRYAAGRAEDPDDGYDEGDEGDVDTEGGWNDAPRPRGQFRRRAQESRPEGSDDQP